MAQAKTMAKRAPRNILNSLIFNAAYGSIYKTNCCLFSDFNSIVFGIQDDTFIIPIARGSWFTDDFVSRFP